MGRDIPGASITWVPDAGHMLKWQTPRDQGSCCWPPVGRTWWPPTAARSIQEILDHADELAARFEDYEPRPGDERPVEECLLERGVLARARSERQIVDPITTQLRQACWDAHDDPR